MPSDLVEKVAKAVYGADHLWDDFSEVIHEGVKNIYRKDARTGIAVVLREQMGWITDKAYANVEQGSDLWDWEATTHAAIREFARENGIEL